MPQITPVIPTFKKNKVLITYKKVEETKLTSATKLVKSGYNHIVFEENKIFDLNGVTSLEIDNIGETNVMVNGILLLAFSNNDEYVNGSYELGKIVKRNSKIFVHGDGTYSDISLDINFIGEAIEMTAPHDASGLPIYSENTQEILANLNVSDDGIALEKLVVYSAYNLNYSGSGSGIGVGLENFVVEYWGASYITTGISGNIIGYDNFASTPFAVVVGLDANLLALTDLELKTLFYNSSHLVYDDTIRTGSEVYLENLRRVGGDSGVLEISGINGITSWLFNYGSTRALRLLDHTLENLNIQSVLGLTELVVHGNKLTSLDLTGKIYLENVWASSNRLEYVVLPDPLSIKNIDLTYNALPTDSINQILAKLKSLQFTGNAYLYGGGNAKPSGQGLADKAYLISLGATIITT